MFFASFLESTVVPIPLELILVPLMLANPGRIWRLATISLAGCLFAAAVMYAIGHFAFDTLGAPLIERMDAQAQLEVFREELRRKGFWLVLAIGILPIPFQVATIGAGLAQFSFPLFLLATVLSRGARYYGLALLTKRFGRRFYDVIKRQSRRTKITATAASVLVVAAMAWLL